MHRFLDLSDLSDSALETVLARARECEQNPVSGELSGRVFGLLFLDPSVRTLASAQAAMAQLGGATFVITPGRGSWMLETRTGVVMDGEAAEHIREAIPVLAQYGDALGVRSFARGQDLEEDLADREMREMAALCPVPFVNLESAIAHPCQALADWKTLDDLRVARRGGRLVLTWAYHPKALPLAVPASVVTMAARRGMEVTVLRPPGFGLPPAVMSAAEDLARRAGGSVVETEDREVAMRGAHVLYAKSWTAPSAYGRPEAEQQLRSEHRSWCVDESWFRSAAPGCRFMHCLPVRRNVVVADEVLDGPRSAVIRQAGNRLHVQKALLLEMIAARRGPGVPAGEPLGSARGGVR